MTDLFMLQLLWPYLFEFLCVESYSGALCDLYRCLTIFAKRMNEEDRLHLGSSSLNGILRFGARNCEGKRVNFFSVRLPGIHQILARLFVTVGGPVPDQIKRSVAGLQLMKELGKLFHSSLPTVWDSELPKLEDSLECKYG